MRQNVIKAAAAEAATTRQRACMCMCGARKEPSRTGWQREPSAKWKCRRVTYLTTMWHVQRSTDFAAHSRPATPPPTLGISRHVLIVMLFRRLLSIGPRREQPKRERERGGTRSVHCHSLCGTCTNWKQNSNKIWLVFCVPTHETRAGTATGTELRVQLALGAQHRLASLGYRPRTHKLAELWPRHSELGKVFAITGQSV